VRTQEVRIGLRRYRVNRLVYFEYFSDINQAIGREKDIRRMMRRQKI